MEIEKENWARRVNQILMAVNEGRGAETIKPPLSEEEMESYNRHVEVLKAEQERVNEDCKKLGIKPWKASFDMLEVE